MKHTISQFRNIMCAALILISLLFAVNIITSSDAEGYYDSMEEYERAFDFSTKGGTLKKLFKGLGKVLGIVKVCIVDKVVYNLNALEYTCIPDVIGRDIDDDGCKNSKSYATKGIKAMGLATIISMIVIFFIAVAATAGLFLVPLLLVMGIILMIVLDACIGSYVIAPHELVNMKNGKWNYKKNKNGDYRNIAKGAVHAIDVPFLYNCKDPGDSKKPIYGSMHGTTFCSGINKNNAVEKVGGNLQVGSIYVGGVSFWKRLVSRSDQKNRFPNLIGSVGNKGQDSLAVMTKENIKDGKFGKIASGWKSSYRVAAFYRYKSGRVELCAALISVLPVIAGCSSVPPPFEKGDTYKDSTLSKTRCSYFLSGSRSDLNNYAEKKLQAQSNKQNLQALYFLAGDIHIGSTVIGCISDLIEITLVNPNYDRYSSSYQNSPEPLLLKAQRGIKDIVMAILVLYITLLGIKIMTSAQVPQRAEWMMYLVKLLVVYIFAINDPWYDNNNMFAKGDGPGLYTGMTAMTRKIADIFMQASDLNDPIRACYYPSGRFAGNGENINLLSEIDIPLGDANYSSRFPSKKNNQSVLRMTVWDYLDCKIANYLNFGTCKYELGSILLVWLIPSAILSGVAGLILALIQCVYMIVIVGIILKFMHVVIINAFMVAILVLMAPIFVCFFLFDYTKDIFKNWVKHLIGYTMYPGMLFAFIALMIATFDSIFYGIPTADIAKEREKIQNGSRLIDIDKLCGNVSSPYCTTYSFLKHSIDSESASKEGDQSCNYALGELYDSLIEKKTILWFIEYEAVKGDFVDALYWPMINIMLFSLMFYIFSQSIIEFFEGLFNVASTGDGAVDFAKGIAKAVAGAAKMKAQGGKAVAKALVGSKDDKGDKKKRE